MSDFIEDVIRHPTEFSFVKVVYLLNLIHATEFTTFRQNGLFIPCLTGTLTLGLTKKAMFIGQTKLSLASAPTLRLLCASSRFKIFHPDLVGAETHLCAQALRCAGANPDSYRGQRTKEQLANFFDPVLVSPQTQKNNYGIVVCNDCTKATPGSILFLQPLLFF